MDPKSQFIDTWLIHNRINLFLLDSIGTEQLDAVSSSKGRTVGEQLAHMHNVRLLWLKSMSPDLLEGIADVPREGGKDKNLFASAFEKSGAAVAALIDASYETGVVPRFKPHLFAFIGYLISHESHHRGQIMLALKQSGFTVDRRVQYGLWQWGER